MSHQKYSFLPDAHTDFIYSIIGEEFGIVGTIVVLACFLLLFKRAARTANRAPNTFGYVLALGIGMSICATAVLNIAMTLGLMPTAGLPLPFISYGGSSLVTSLAGMGLLLNISSEGVDRAHRVRRTAVRKSKRTVFARRARRPGKRTTR
jgi:cell division protein FtsW